MVFQNDILAGASVAGGYTIDQSIRFNEDDTAYLSRTNASAPTSTTVWTCSFWVKRGALGTNQYILNAGPFNFGDDQEAIYFVSNDTFRVQLTRSNSVIGYLNTTAVFRDVSAWYNFVIVRDGQSYAIYVNGAAQTGTSSFGSNPASYVNAATQQDIGNRLDNLLRFDGYLAEFYCVDGQALAPTDFGEYNDDGVWVPKQYAGTYGTNGFYITGEDSADLGADYSGNGNDFTSSGLTASSQVLDTPTDNYCVMNDLVQNRDGNITNSDGIRAANLEIYRPSASTNSFGSGTMAVYGGVGSPKLYYECYTTSYPGGNVLQMYIEDASSSENVSSSSFGLNQRHTTSAYRLFIYPGGSETPASWTSEFGQGVYVGLAVDFANDEISANVDGTEIFSYDAAELAALSGITIDTFAGRWWRPKIQVANDQPTTIDVNFGQNAFQNAPTGYVGWSTSAIPTPTIADGSAHFYTNTYTGTGVSGTSITNDASAGDFKPDLLWVKPRSVADNHVVFDSVRGTTSRLYPNKSDAQDTDATALITFETNGFDLDTTDRNYNQSGTTYVAWQWHTTGGTSSSNTDGSITSTVSANTTAGFSVVTYTGTGSAATIGHGLSTAPSCIFAKARTSAYNWKVYHSGLTSAGYRLILDSPAAQAADSTTWNNTDPTSSVFSVSTDNGTNASSVNYVAYCFAEVEGFSKFGKYTGNGSADGPFVWCGFKPAFILFKNASAYQSWCIFDVARQTYNVLGPLLLAEQSDAETSVTYVDALSNGFKLRTTNARVNGSGATHIFMAFAEHPFGGDGVAPVPAR